MRHGDDGRARDDDARSRGVDRNDGRTIDCRNLGYRYGRRTVFSDVSFALGPGVTGLLGVNGAGKTTLLTILATLRKPTTGRALLLGNDAATVDGRRRIRRNLGYLPQSFEVMGSSTVLDNVVYAAWAHGVDCGDAVDAARRALNAVGLADTASLRARTLSGGQRQRLGIACAIAHRPGIVLLDEPTAGIDPGQRARLRALIAEIGRRSTVVLSTHLVDDVTRVCGNLLMLMDGGLSYAGPVRDLVDDGPATATDIARRIEMMMAGER